MRAHVVPGSGDSRVGSHQRGEIAHQSVAAFLDGVQRSEVVAWSDATPIVYAHVRAAIRARVDRRLITWGSGPLSRSALYVPRALATTLAGVEGMDVIALDPDESSGDSHPHLTIRHAYRRVQAEREAAERRLAEAFVRESDAPLYVDGGLPASHAVLRGGGALGVVKSHHTLYVSGDALRTVLALAEGERSSVFEVGMQWGRDAVASWYLRLRDAAARDPFWGLVRVEVPRRRLHVGVGAAADHVSALILAERSPLALPDARWDTMVYGIRDCEEYLAASIPVGR